MEFCWTFVISLGLVFAYYASWSNVQGDVKLFCPRQLLCKSDSNRSFVVAFRLVKCRHNKRGLHLYIFSGIYYSKNGFWAVINRSRIPSILNFLLWITLNLFDNLPFQSSISRGTQREYSSKPLKNSIAERILVFKQ